jgi:hypothetical protein
MQSLLFSQNEKKRPFSGTVVDKYPENVKSVIFVHKAGDPDNATFGRGYFYFQTRAKKKYKEKLNASTVSVLFYSFYVLIK